MTTEIYFCTCATVRDLHVSCDLAVDDIGGTVVDYLQFIYYCIGLYYSMR